MGKNLQWLQDDPLRRVPGESRRAAAALHDYALMGAARSLRHLVEHYKERNANPNRTMRPPTTHYGTMNTWSSYHDWQARVQRFDELERAREAEKWREYKKTVRDEDRLHAQQMRELCANILKTAPSFLKQNRKATDAGAATIVDAEGNVMRKGRPAREVVTVALDTSFLLKAERLSSELANLAANPDGKTPTNNNFNYDPSKMTAEQLQRVIDGESPLVVMQSRTPDA